MAVSNGYLTMVLTAETAVPERKPDILSWSGVVVSDVCIVGSSFVFLFVVPV